MKQLLLLISVSCLPFSALAASPDIILMMSDDHGWEETGYNGHPHVKTPVLDEWLSHDNFFEMDPMLSRNGGPPEAFKGESSEILIREAIAAIGRAREAGKPVFLVIWFGSPHEPYSGLPEDLALYDDL